MIGAFIVKKKVSSSFDALNRRNVSAFLSDWKDDCTFNYPGNIAVSGSIRGKKSIEIWFKNFMEQFPKIKFTVKNICVENIIDFVGTNVVAAHWDLDQTNRDGKLIHNSGVTVINIKYSKAILVTDYIYDTGDKFKTAWGVV